MKIKLNFARKIDDHLLIFFSIILQKLNFPFFSPNGVAYHYNTELFFIFYLLFIYLFLLKNIKKKELI